MNRFARIPEAVVRDDRLTLRDYRVLATLWLCADRSGQCHPSREHIAELTGYPPQRISVVTARLQKLGWITKTGHGGRSQSTHYQLHETVTEPVTVLEGETVTDPVTVLEGETVTEPVTVLEGETVTEPVTVLEGETVTEPVTVLDETVTEPVTVSDETVTKTVTVSGETVTKSVTGKEHTTTKEKIPPIVPPKTEMVAQGPVDSTASSETENKTADQKLPCRFAEFWAAWPSGYKAGKPKALKAWKAKKLDAIADTLIADIEQRQQRDARWREGFIPNPTTYLNQERWTDDFRPPKPDRDARQRIVDYLYDFGDDEPASWGQHQPAVSRWLQ